MSVGNFAILSFVDPIGIVITPSGMEIPGGPGTCESLLDSRRIAYGMADPISKPVWRYTIGSTPDFGSFRAAKMTPFWDPNFTPPVWSIGGPISLCPQGPWTKFQVVHSDMSLRSCHLSCEPSALPWPGEPCVRMVQILVILAS